MSQNESLIRTGGHVSTHLLRAIRTQHEDGLVAVRERDTVHPCPNVTETSRGELDTRGEAELRVTRELRVRLAVMQKMLGGDVTFDGRDQVLRGNAMA